MLGRQNISVGQIQSVAHQLETSEEPESSTQSPRSSPPTSSLSCETAFLSQSPAHVLRPFCACCQSSLWRLQWDCRGSFPLHDEDPGSRMGCSSKIWGQTTRQVLRGEVRTTRWLCWDMGHLGPGRHPWHPERRKKTSVEPQTWFFDTQTMLDCTMGCTGSSACLSICHID